MKNKKIILIGICGCIIVLGLLYGLNNIFIFLPSQTRQDHTITSNMNEADNLTESMQNTISASDRENDAYTNYIPNENIILDEDSGHTYSRNN